MKRRGFLSSLLGAPAALALSGAAAKASAPPPATPMPEPIELPQVYPPGRYGRYIVTIAGEAVATDEPPTGMAFVRLSRWTESDDEIPDCYDSRALCESCADVICDWVEATPSQIVTKGAVS